jgi:SAM-dependent methyltransferase
MTVPLDWWQTFFKGVVVELWLQIPTEEQTRQEADFLERVLRPPPGGRILDVPCGGGRHALAMAARGYRMTGVDLAPEFLARARADSAQRNLAVDWQQREMRDLPWREEFDAAYCFGNSFGYLDEDGNAAYLQAVARCLKPGARFALETGYVAESLLPALQERRWFQIGNVYWLMQNRYDPTQGRYEQESTILRDGKTERCAYSARIYTYRELLRLFEEAGFEGVEGCGGLNQEPYRLGAPRLLLTATRRAR